MTERLYLAGPMRGIPHFNFPAFDAAAARLREAGFVVFNPAEHDRSVYGDAIADSPTGDLADAEAVGFNLRSVLLVDLAWIIQHADGIALLPGWSASYGARAEAFVGHALGLRVAPVSEWLGR
jgi:hypothetical protein